MARTATLVLQEELERIEKILRESQTALSHADIAAALAGRFEMSLSAGVLQRRLGTLVESGRVTRQGRNKGTKYAWARRENPPGPTPNIEASDKHSQWLSAEGIALRSAVQQPRETRRYVTYRRAWLESYVPGQTWYLSEGIRKHLQRMGQTPAGERPAGTFAREILSRLLIDLSWASSRLEGNTYSLLDTQNLIEFGHRAEGKDAAEAQMILNHKEAIEYLVARQDQHGIDAHSLRTLHAILASGLVRNAADEGRLRSTPIGITSSTYIPTEDPHIIRECFEQIAVLSNAIPDPFEKSFFLLVHIPYLQPFIDVNKRTSRLAANIPLIEANLCPLTFVDTPEEEYVRGILAVYELQRTELLRDVYVHAYERSCERYTVVREASAQPDPLRLRHRDFLAESIRDAVRGRIAPDRQWGAQRARARGIPEAEQEAIAELLVNLVLNLNDASAARYGLRPSEYTAWRQKFTPA